MIIIIFRIGENEKAMVIGDKWLKMLFLSFRELIFSVSTCYKVPIRYIFKNIFAQLLSIYIICLNNQSQLVIHCTFAEFSFTN